MRPTPTCLLVTVVAILFAGCSTSEDGAFGTVNGAVRPCNSGQPSFDVWRADFAPNDRTDIVIAVNTREAATAAEFRLALACQDEIVATIIDGAICGSPPPKIADGPDPQCPFLTISVDDLDFGDDDTDGRIQCLLEIGTTESLAIGTGGCADDAFAEYSVRMMLDTATLALDLDRDDCRAEDSCLESEYGLEEADDN